ncbi:MAG: hypothetical protein JWN41_969, partial [Thermoleophilia bacterium]|nr:hypothetical protein [Thermoleophilia bacterium]
MKEGTETLLNYEPLQPIDRARSHAFASATGALAGLTVGAVAAVVTRGHALPAVINSLPRMLVVSGGAGFGVSLIANAVTGG